MTSAAERPAAVAPVAVLGGLGRARREHLAAMLAFLERAGHLMAELRALLRRFHTRDPEEDIRRPLAELAAAARRIEASECDTDDLRLALWRAILEALSLDEPLPLSTRTAGQVCARVAGEAAAALAAEASRCEDTSALRSLPVIGHLLDLVAPAHPDFSRLVRKVREGMATASGAGAVDLQRLAEELRSLGSDVRFAAGATGGTAAGLAATGAAVEAAGFSAYILAAKLGATLPFLTPIGATSLLAVLANPLMLFAATTLGAGWTLSRARDARRRAAAVLVVQLAAGAGDDPAAGLQAFLQAARRAPLEGHRLEPWRRYRQAVVDLLDRELPGWAARVPPPGAMPPALRRPIRAAPAAGVGGDDRADMAVATGLTLGELAFASASIHPAVVAAVDFASTEAEDRLIDFVLWAGDLQARSAAALAGEFHRVAGYVAERLAALLLAAQNHCVEFPSTSNNPGFDLVVDGQPVQVKCLADPDGLAEHFSRYPDTGVLANEELARSVAESDLPWKDRVFTVTGFSREEVHRMLDDGIDGALELNDLDAPVFAVVPLVLRGIVTWALDRRQRDLADIATEVAERAAVRAATTAVAGVLAKTAAVALFGPAGGVVFGSAAALAGIPLGSHVQRGVFRTVAAEWYAELDRASAACAHAFGVRARDRLAALGRKVRSLGPCRDEEQVWISLRMFDEAVFAAEALLALTRLAEVGDPEERARGCIEAVTRWGLHPVAACGELARMREVMDRRPGLAEATLDRVTALGAGLRALLAPGAGRA